MNSIDKEWCPICGKCYNSLTVLSAHMLNLHNRLILEKDMNAARDRRSAKYRALELAEEI